MVTVMIIMTTMMGTTTIRTEMMITEVVVTGLTGVVMAMIPYESGVITTEMMVWMVTITGMMAAVMSMPYLLYRQRRRPREYD